MFAAGRVFQERAAWLACQVNRWGVEKLRLRVLWSVKGWNSVFLASLLLNTKSWEGAEARHEHGLGERLGMGKGRSWGIGIGRGWGMGIGKGEGGAQTWAETQASVYFQDSVLIICVWLHLALLLPSCVSLACIQTGDRTETHIRVGSTLKI